LKKSIEIQLFGDVSLNGLFGNPENLSELRINLEKLQAKIGRGDLRMINWEAPVTQKFVFNELKSPAIATTEISAKLFCDTFPLDVACLGNNHIGDCMDEGFLTTKAFFKERRIQTVGAGESIDEAEELIVKEVNGISIGILSFTGSETNPKIHPSSNIFLNMMTDVDKMCRLIKESKSKVDHLLINLHWGIEFIQFPNPIQKELARKCIDSGASIIIGHHSHCLQGVERYKQGVIFYSLGNFLFSGLKGKETIGWPKHCNRGGAYKVFIDSKNIHSFEFIPFYVSNSGVHIDENLKENIKVQNSINRRLSFSGAKYLFFYRVNVMLNWFIRLPLFLVKTKGGFFKALYSYANPKYFKLLLHYFNKKT